jgi:hypothetical protein
VNTETAPFADNRVISVARSHIRLALDTGRCPKVKTFFDEATFTAMLWRSWTAMAG